MGTSLRVHGLKVMIREFAKAVHTKGGKVVFVNQTKPSESIWGDFIDYWVEWDCDEWVMDLRDRREDIWTGVLEEKSKERTETAKRWRPQALRDDKTNGAYLTFKILDTLSKVRDEDGRMASRFLYWPAPASRVSNVSIPVERTTSNVPNKKGQFKTRKSEHSKKPAKATTKAKSNKRKSQPEEYIETEEDRKNVAYIVSKMWQDLRKIAPDLPAPPPELRIPFSNFKSNATDYLKPFSFSSTSTPSNHFPNVGTWPLNRMNLVSLPPSGSTIPIHTPKSKPKTEEKPKPPPRPNHGYGTRASRRFSSAETIVVDSGEKDVVMEPELPRQQEPIVQLGEEQEQDDTIVVAEDPMTPVSKRIKRNCSIGALMSSSPEEWHDAMEVVS